MNPFPDEARLPAPYLNPRQSQPRAPSAYENLLGDALEAAFREGAGELPQVIERLNAGGIRTPDGGAWTAENFVPILESLGR
jgi:hypothetical protein